MPVRTWSLLLTANPMVRKDFLRKRCAKRHFDALVHENLASVGRSPAVRQALERLMVYVPNRTDLLSPVPLGGQPSWAKSTSLPSKSSPTPGPSFRPGASETVVRPRKFAGSC